MGISLRKNKVESSDKPAVEVVVSNAKKVPAPSAKRQVQEFSQQFPSCADIKRAAAVNSVRKEIIHIQLGQAGNQIGSKFWESLGRDHGIDFGGKFYGHSETQLHHICSYYNDLSDGRYVPRALALDLESGTMKFFKTSAIGRSFNPENIIYDQETSRNSWAAAYYDTGRYLNYEVMDVIQREVERCDWFQGFQFVHSLAGGTGSGYGSLLMQCLRDEYPDRVQITFSVLPSSSVSHVVIEPYNTLLCLNQLLNCSDATFYFDNQRLFYTAGGVLNLKGSFSDVNNIIASNMLGVTTQFRFPDQSNGSLRKFTNALVPVQDLKFLSSSFSPVVSQDSVSYRAQNVQELVLQLSHSYNQTSLNTAERGQHLAVAAVFRGQVSAKLVDDEMTEMRQRNCGNFANCCRDNIVTSICPLQQPGHKICATLISNNTSVQESFTPISEQFVAMFRRKAFIYTHTQEGGDEMDLTEAESNIYDVIQHCKSLENGESWKDTKNSTWKASADEPRVNSSQG